jgi:hypothetical protein
MMLALEVDIVVRRQPRFQHFGQDDMLALAVAPRQRLVGRQIAPAQVDQQLQGRQLRADFFQIGVGRGHG